jgi:hypothetical protein
MDFLKDRVREMQAYAAFLTSPSGDTTSDTERKLVREMLEAVAAAYHDYGVATISISNWGDAFAEVLGKRSTSAEDVRKVLYFLAQLAREHSLKSNLVPRPPAAAVLNYLVPTNPLLTVDGRQLADYTWNGLPRDVIRELVSTHLKKQKDFDAKIETWQKSLDAWDEKVEGHQKTLRNIHQRYNFVELSKAFSEMYASKAQEKNWMLLWLLFFGLLLTLPILAQLPVGRMMEWDFLRVEWIGNEWIKVLPLAALEIVLLYFFRILLRNYQSTKAQLLQLDLRQALCAFIESYVHFAQEKGVASKEQHPLSKFENIVFSGLSPDPENVPSTFDAFDQLVKVAKELKK